MFSVKDFIEKYEQYSDEELMAVYDNINGYSTEAKEALEHVINKKGGIERLVKSMNEMKAKRSETDRIAAEAKEFADKGVDASFIKKITNSELLSPEEIHSIIDEKQSQALQENADKQIKARTVAGSFIGGVLAGVIFGIAFGAIMVYSNRIFYIFAIGLMLGCYYSIRLATGQSIKNMIVLAATVLSVILAVLIAQFIYSNPYLIGVGPE